MHQTRPESCLCSDSGCLRPSNRNALHECGLQSQMCRRISGSPRECSVVAGIGIRSLTFREPDTAEQTLNNLLHLVRSPRHIGQCFPPLGFTPSQLCEE